MKPDPIKIAFQVLKALKYLNDHGIIHRLLSARNIAIDSNGDVKLMNYGLYYTTNGGRDVEFPIG